jgi:hypothetical protein
MQLILSLREVREKAASFIFGGFQFFLVEIKKTTLHHTEQHDGDDLKC